MEFILTLLSKIGVSVGAKKGIAAIESLSSKISGLIKKTSETNSNNLKSYINGSETSTSLNRAICFFQGHYLEYSLEISERHKALRVYIDSVPKDDLSKPEVVNEVYKLFSELLGHFNRPLGSIFTEFEEILQDIYHTRGKSMTYKPRICIKGIMPSPYSSGTPYIGEIRRVDSRTRFSAFPITENTGFDEAYNRGRRYINNDIPKSVLNGQYENNRLIKNIVNAQAPFSYAEDNFDDKKWQSCWKEVDDKPAKPSSCYKSTLIIPLTMTKNLIEGRIRTREMLGIKEHDFKGRTIGFLCFDHQLTEYFDSEDIDTGYIFADCLSLYFFTRHNYTFSSQTFREAEKILLQSGQFSEIDLLEKISGGDPQITKEFLPTS